MKEVCIPLPYLSDSEIAEVDVTINSREKHYNYRIESFPWKVEQKVSSEDERFDQKIQGLKRSIKQYDSAWELLQIFSPEAGSECVHVLYRKKL